MGNIMLSGRGNIVNMDWIYGTPKLRILRASLCLIWTPAKMNVWPAIRDMLVMLRAPGHVRGCHSVIVNTPETCASCLRGTRKRIHRQGWEYQIFVTIRDQRGSCCHWPAPSEGRRQRLSPLCVNIIVILQSLGQCQCSLLSIDPSNDSTWNETLILESFYLLYMFISVLHYCNNLLLPKLIFSLLCFLPKLLPWD